MADVDASLVQKVFDIAKRERKSYIHKHAKLNDLRRGFEIAERVLGHLPRPTALPGRLKPRSPDITMPYPGAPKLFTKGRPGCMQQKMTADVEETDA